jgi:hypothetical protein
MGLLLEGWNKMLSIVHKLFAFPLFFGTTAVVLLLNYRMMKRIDFSKERKRESAIGPILIYSGGVVILAFYMLNKAFIKFCS